MPSSCFSFKFCRKKNTIINISIYRYYIYTQAHMCNSLNRGCTSCCTLTFRTRTVIRPPPPQPTFSTHRYTMVSGEGRIALFWLYMYQIRDSGQICLFLLKHVYIVKMFSANSPLKDQQGFVLICAAVATCGLAVVNSQDGMRENVHAALREAHAEATENESLTDSEMK